MRTTRWVTALALLMLLAAPRSSTAQVCVGDCDGSGRPTVDELVRGVNILLGRAELSLCTTLDTSGDGKVAVNELVRAVADVLFGCGVTPPTPEPTNTRTATPTATSTSLSASPTPTRTQSLANVAGEWREDEYDLVSSTCISEIDDLVEELIGELPSCVYTVEQSGADVTLTDCDGVGATGTFDDTGVVVVDLPINDQTMEGCTLVFDPLFRGDLRSSPTTVEQTLDLSFEGTCELAQCRLVVSSRWTRL